VTGVAVHLGQIYALEAFTGFDAPSPPAATTGMVFGSRAAARGTASFPD
jgi:hypothetical protein